MCSGTVGRAVQMSANKAFSHNRKGLDIDMSFFVTSTQRKKQKHAHKSFYFIQTGLIGAKCSLISFNTL